MPNSGPVGKFSASPQSTAPDEDFVGPFPSGPKPGWNPTQIVQGFLAASASYPANAAIARQYLVSSASKHWNPGWSVTVFRKLVPDHAVYRHAGQQATVGVTGTVQAAFNGSGQFISAQATHRSANAYQFNLVKVNGQWRIANPPPSRLLTRTEFTENYKPQDLYFFSPQNHVLVPDSVFVPQGTTSTALVSNLVTALLKGPDTGSGTSMQSRSAWLQDATTTFPAGTRLLDVTLAGSTAVVNLGGTLAQAGRQVREQVSAQLVWTLAASKASLSSPIQSVELEINGKAWIPPATTTICGASPSQSPVQKQAAYGCYDPYPATQASFSFIQNGTALSRCGWEQKVAQAGSIGSVVPVFGRTAHPLGAQPCDPSQFVNFQSPAVPPPGQLRAVGPVSKLAVSPDGKYAAYVSPGSGPRAPDAVHIQPVATVGTPYKPLKAPGVTALGWDRLDELWLAQSGAVWMVPTATGAPVSVPVTGSGDVTSLSLAPDGVRVALIVQTGSGREILLAAINRGGQPAAGQRGVPSVRVSLSQGVQLGPNLADPVALTWYDADNLLVLDGATGQNKLYEVPVDGQQSSGAPLTPAGATSITAYGAENALVAGLSGGQLAVSASLEGPWQPLAVHGRDPAYPG